MRQAKRVANDLPDRMSVLLAEFQTLRDEMLQRTGHQTALFGVTVTALAAALAFGPTVEVLVMLPWIALVITIAMARHWYWYQMMSLYLRKKLIPAIRDEVGQVPSWEDDNLVAHRSALGVVAVAVLEGTIPASYVVIGFTATCLLAQQNHKELVLPGLLASLVALLVIGVVGIRTLVQEKRMDATTPLGQGQSDDRAE